MILSSEPHDKAVAVGGRDSSGHPAHRGLRKLVGWRGQISAPDSSPCVPRKQQGPGAWIQGHGPCGWQKCLHVAKGSPVSWDQ